MVLNQKNYKKKNNKVPEIRLNMILKFNILPEIFKPKLLFLSKIRLYFLSHGYHPEVEKNKKYIRQLKN